MPRRLTSSLYSRHSSRPQRRNQVRRLRRRQNHRSPRQNPPSRPNPDIRHQRRRQKQQPQPLPPGRRSGPETKIHDRHPHVHVARSHQRAKRRPPRRHRRLVARLRDPGNVHGPAAVGLARQRVGHHVQHRARQPAAAADQRANERGGPGLPAPLLRARSPPPRQRRRAAAVRLDPRDPPAGRRGRRRGRGPDAVQ